MKCGLMRAGALIVNLFLVTALFAQHPDHSGSVGDYATKQLHLPAAGRTNVGKIGVRRFASEPISGSFTGVIVRARSTNEWGPAWFRINDASGPSEWFPAVTLGDDDSPIRLFAFRSESPLAGASVEFAVAGDHVTILEAGFFDNRNDDDDAQSIEWDLGQTALGKTSGKIIPPRLIKRSEWGARPFRGEPIPLARPTYDYITFHHAACCGAHSYAEGVAQVSSIQQFHQDGRGWSDIGYHFVMDQTGRLYQGRPFMNEGADLDDTPILAQGAHAGGANTGNIGVSALGCYHPPEGSGCQDVMSPAALDSLVTVFAFLSERYGVPPSDIKGHRDFSSTACPGDNNYNILPQIRTMVQELLETGNAPVGAAQMSASSDTDGVVKLNWQFTRNDGIVEYRVERNSPGESDVIYSSHVVEDNTFVDEQVGVAGEVSYDLQARNANGRWATLSSVVVEVARPGRFQLSQSFPNPTSTSTTIRYFLEQEGFVTLELFDATGRQQSVLVNTYQQQGRWHAVDINTTGLAAGQYFYRMTVESFAGIIFDESVGLTVER